MATYQMTEDEARKIGVIASQLNKELRETALIALKKVGAGASAAVPALREILRSSSATPATLTDAIDTLGSIGEPAASAVPEMLNLFKQETDHKAILDGSSARAKLLVDAIKKIGPNAAPPIVEYLNKYEKDFLVGRPHYGPEVEKFAGCLECYIVLNPPTLADKDRDATIKSLKFLRSQADLRKDEKKETYKAISRRITDALNLLEGKK
jgi:hypothetical protein